MKLHARLSEPSTACLTILSQAAAAQAQELSLEDLMKKAEERREKQAKQYYEDVG
jgi:hypothetical protein